MTAISAELSGDFGKIENIFIDSIDCGDFYGGCNVFNAPIASWSEFSISSFFLMISITEIVKENRLIEAILDVHTGKIGGG